MWDRDDVGVGREQSQRPHADALDLAVVAADGDPVAGPVGTFEDGGDAGDQAADVVLEGEADGDAGRTGDHQEVLQRDIEDDRDDPKDRDAEQQQAGDRHDGEDVEAQLARPARGQEQDGAADQPDRQSGRQQDDADLEEADVLEIVDELDALLAGLVGTIVQNPSSGSPACARAERIEG